MFYNNSSYILDFSRLFMKSDKFVISGLAFLLALSGTHMLQKMEEIEIVKKEYRQLESDYKNMKQDQEDYLTGRTIPRDSLVFERVAAFEKYTKIYQELHRLLTDGETSLTIDILESLVMTEYEKNQDVLEYLDDESTLISPLTLGLAKGRVKRHTDFLQNYFHAYREKRGPLPVYISPDDVFINK